MRRPPSKYAGRPFAKGSQPVARDPEKTDAPETAEKKPFLLRIPPDLMAELRSWANQDLRSLNAHIEFLLREAVKTRRGGGGKKSE